MPPALRIKGAERLTLRGPYTERTRRWNALLVWQWQVVEAIRRTTAGRTSGSTAATRPRAGGEAGGLGRRRLDGVDRALPAAAGRADPRAAG
ncbi:MAG: hypothetical protein AB1505_13665 [Candidatus Latescibacterota bacterium]